MAKPTLTSTITIRRQYLSRLSFQLPWSQSLRCLHTTTLRARSAYQSITTRQPAQASPMLLAKQQYLKTRIKDLGILPGTFIMPTGDKKPSLLREPRRRWRLEFHRLKCRITDLRGLMTYKFMDKLKNAEGVVVRGPKGKKPKQRYPRLGRGQIIPTAQALHRRMYTAFAEKDIPTLSNICMEGLLSSFQTRIGLRPSREVHEWALHKYTHSPRIVSHRAALIQEGSIMRQAVVRIRSLQSLEKYTKETTRMKKEKEMEVGSSSNSSKSSSSSKEEDTTAGGGMVGGVVGGKMMDEYVVIQKNIFQGVEDDWMIWGTTKESDVSEIIGR